MARFFDFSVSVRRSAILCLLLLSMLQSSVARQRVGLVLSGGGAKV